jgi:cell division protein FtsW
MNIAVAVGVMPVTGQTLPMISRGGTSIIVISVYFGMILSVSRYGEVDQNTEEVKNKEV